MNDTQPQSPSASVLSPGDRHIVQIVRMAYEGKAVALINGLVIFIPGGAPGDRLEVEVVSVHARFAEGRIVQILEPGPDRVEARCPNFLSCGGCHLQHLSPAAQAEIKHKFVTDTLSRIGGLKDVPVLPVKADVDPWAYRNKMNYHVRVFKEGMILGLYDWPTNELVDLETCPIQAPSLERAWPIIREHFREAHARGLHGKFEISMRGDRPPATNLFLVQRYNNPDLRLEELAEKLNSIEGTAPWSVIDRHDIRGKGSFYNAIRGEGHNLFEVGGIKLRLAPQAFAQVNLRQAGVMLDVIEEFAALKGTETVLDAYCGIGFITLRLARTAKVVYGVESSPEAVKDAEMNASINNIDNVKFVCRDTGKALRGKAFGDVEFDLLVVDPPREGCQLKALETFIQCGLKRIIYVSCNPATLARDLKILGEAGYKTLRVQPIDMFPQTYHVESVVEVVRG